MGYFLGMLKLTGIELELTGKLVNSELEKKIKETMTNPSLSDNSFTVAFKKPGQKINLSTYLNTTVINSVINSYDETMTLYVSFIGYTKHQILLENQDNAKNEKTMNEKALKEIINSV